MNLIGLGAGGHGLSVWDAITSDGMDTLIGWLDDTKPTGSLHGGLPILGQTNSWPEDAEGFTVTVGRDREARQHLWERWQQQPNPVIRHRTAVVSPDAEIGDGSQILALAYVGPNARIGRNVVVNTGAIVEHDTVIGDHVFIAPGALILGEARIGAGAFIGAGSIVLPGREVAAGVLLPAGRTVAHGLYPPAHP